MSELESQIKELDGFDPLQGAPQPHNDEDPNKPVILNVLNSYTGFYDLFSELVQNALDAVQVKARTDATYTPRLWILVDMKSRRVRVTDNGVGMGIDQFKFCFRPNVTFKRGAGLRGNKGVGATYLAYGFSLVRIQSKHANHSIAAILRGGRRWAEDISGVVPRPKLEGKPFDVPELESESSGASFEVILGDSPGERPRDLNWIGARNAKQWLDVLRIKTPLGAVTLRTPPFRPTVHIQVVDPDGVSTYETSSNAEYYYPHEITGKVASLTDIKTALEKVPGDAATKFAKLGNEYKKLDCMYEVWDKKAILDDTSDFASVLDAEEAILVERHKVVVYAAFLSSSKQWSDFNDNVIGLRKGQRIMQGGLQLACDGMVQGDPLVIPLTSTIGYQANAHVVVHLTEGNPDMGRKVFQPELKRMAEKLAVRAVGLFKRHLQHRRPEAGPPNISASKQLHEWKKAQEAYRDRKPLDLTLNGMRLALVSEPQQEQDVVGLFHELLGVGLLKGYRIFATSQSETYDSLYELDYPDSPEYRYEQAIRPLGVAARYLGSSTEPRVLEYKYDFDGLLDDIEQEVKSQSHIQLVVCWSVSRRYQDKFFFRSLLIGDEGSERVHFGATHQAFAESSSEMVFEVLVLKDLLNFVADRAAEEARQKQYYKDD
ncbi:MAG: hypothetical protein AD742_11195 [Methylibium sp. NZG]|nr:MAG: hypothetical protein AD742_11195 [Methylibium sp. NZG]